MTARYIQKVCTRTHKIAIERLKGIRGLDEVSLEHQPITGIFGPNGSGKSTVLHALAAAYNDPNQARAHHYKSFFPRLGEDVWNGTRFVITHSGESGSTTFQNAEEAYRKGTQTTRWQPLENRRPLREVLYVGLRDCLPALEKYSAHDLHGGTFTELTDPKETRALRFLGNILSGNYSKAYSIALANHPTREYSAFEREDLTCTYPSVTMGSGEQRLFAMLRQIERTRKNALILIDEIDILLHGDALVKLIDHLHSHCSDKKKQIVFTSHREELLRLEDKINIRHLYRLNGQHSCLNNTDPDSLHRLTGQRVRPLEVFVEDSLAECIIEEVSRGLGIRRHVSIVRYGSASNCFTVLGGLLLKGEACNWSLFVLDGDVYRTSDEKQRRINAACSGNDANSVHIRSNMLQHIVDLQLPQGRKPEPYLHGLILSLACDSLNVEETEIRRLAESIVQPADGHHFIDKIVENLGGDRSTQLHVVVRMAAKHADWPDYVRPVHDWLVAKKSELNLA